MDPKTMDTVFMSLKEFLITSWPTVTWLTAFYWYQIHTHEETEVQVRIFCDVI